MSRKYRHPQWDVPIRGHPNWIMDRHPDGNDVVYPKFMNGKNYIGDITIERLVFPNSGRKNWALVDRSRGDEDSHSCYPPIHTGPFRSLKAALTAFVLIVGRPDDA